MMVNLNDSIYDYQNYSVYGDRNHPEFIVSDEDSINRLIPYAAFEKNLLSNIVQKKRSIYLRFCDGEYLYYKKGFSFIPWIQKLFGRDKTCRGEKPEPRYLKKHFEIFQTHQNEIIFCPHVSDSWIRHYKQSKLYDFISKNNLSIGHFYYVYHFLNQLRQKKIPELKELKIALVAHEDIHVSSDIDHIITGRTYTDTIGEMLKQRDFSDYDLILVGGGISAPLYANSIQCNCPIIDAGCLINFWDSHTSGDRAFTFIL